MERLKQHPFAICAAFIFFSCSLTLHNKYIFVHVMKSSNVLLFIQNLVGLLMLFASRRLGWIKFEGRIDTLTDLMVGLSYAVNVITGLWALSFLNLVVFASIKRCTIAVTWVLEFVNPTTRNATTLRALAPVALMVGGAVAGIHFGDGVSMAGVSLAAMSCVFQGISFELSRQSSNKADTVWPSVYSNGVLSLFVLVPVLLVTDDWQLFEALKLRVGAVSLVLHLAVNGVLSFALNFFVFLNCYVNSPLAHAVTGNMRIVFVSIPSLMMFESIGVEGGLAMLCIFASGVWFSYVRIK